MAQPWGISGPGLSQGLHQVLGVGEPLYCLCLPSLSGSRRFQVQGEVAGAPDT